MFQSRFFLRLQIETGVELHERKSVIIFDEIQLFPKARQAINNHKSIDHFESKYSKQVGERFLLSQKDVGKIGTLKLKPIYMIGFLLKDL